MINFKSSGNVGDILWALPTIYSLIEKHGIPANIYLHLDMPADYYKGAKHPAGNVRMNRAIANALIPLLSCQIGIAEVKVWEGEHIDVDLDLFRTVAGIGVGHLPRHYFYTFDAYYNLSEPWLWVRPNEHADNVLVVARTSRYRNPEINYRFMNQYMPVFLGLQEEYDDFTKECPDALFLPTKDFYEAAAIIFAAKAFVSNNTALFAIAEGLKVNRCLEVCPYAPNVQPQGGEARSAVNQRGFEANVLALMA